MGLEKIQVAHSKFYFNEVIIGIIFRLMKTNQIGLSFRYRQVLGSLLLLKNRNISLDEYIIQQLAIWTFLAIKMNRFG